MSSSVFLEQLRMHTAPMHKKLEQTYVSQQIVSPGLKIDDYRLYLQKVLSLHTGVEVSVFPAIANIVKDADTRYKKKIIENDLAQTGKTSFDGTPAFIDHHFINDPAFCMGILYVSEGSTLGGMIIVKNVQAALGAAAEDATAFLTVYGRETGSKWKAFLQDLEVFQSACDASATQRIVDGAIYGFERTYQLFSN